MRGAALALAVIVVGTACPGGASAPTPTATPTDAIATATSDTDDLVVGLVLAPPDSIDAADNDRARTAARSVELDADAIDVRVLSPPSQPFVADMLGLLAEEGADLTCGIGRSAVEPLLRVAAELPGARFCVLDAPTGDVATDELLSAAGSNVLVLGIAGEDGAYLAGAAAGMVAPLRAGFLGVRPGYPGVRREQRAFAAGVRSTSPNGTVATAYLGAATETSEEAVFESSSAQFDGGAGVVYARVGDIGAGVVAAAAERSRLVIGWGVDLRTVVDAELERVILMSVVEDLEPALRLAVDRVTSRWRGGTVVLRAADGAVRLVPGDSNVYPSIADRLATIAADLPPLTEYPGPTPTETETETIVIDPTASP